MTRAVVSPDKFRGSLSAMQACDAITNGLHRAGIEDVVQIPMADGGEGTLEVLHTSRGGSLRTERVTGPLGEIVEAEWLLLPDGTAVIEMARASGISLVAGRNDPLRASTRGTGELIALAARAGAHQITVAVGGSASTDGGLAAVEALGWSLPRIPVTVACDVQTFFLDAASGFAPQKGATDAQVMLLTRRLETLAKEYEQRTGVDVRVMEGSGAAGGLAGGLAALGASLESGFDAVAAASGLDEALADAQLVVTGEGKLDASSISGKVVGGVLKLAQEMGTPAVSVIVGQATDDARAELERQENVDLYVLTDRAWQSAEAFSRAAVLLEEAAYECGTRVLTERQ